MPTISELMDFLSKESLQVHYHCLEDESLLELYCVWFDLLGRTAEGGASDSRDLRWKTWLHVATTLIAPVEFDDVWVQQTERILKEAERYVEDTKLQAARAAGRHLKESGNPLRKRCATLIRGAAENGQDFKIYCHRTERPLYESLVPDFAWSESQFIHTRSEYAATELHEVLFKVGPLRATGRGAIPDAVFSAPRSRRLEVIHWAVSRHDAQFGMTVAGERQSASGPAQPPRPPEPRPNSKAPTIDLMDVRPSSPPGDVDQTCLCVILDELLGYLVPAQGSVFQVEVQKSAHLNGTDLALVKDWCPEIVFAPLDEELLGRERLWLAHPSVELRDAKKSLAKAGASTRQWKDALCKAYQDNAPRLIQKLRDAGIQLIQLEAAAKHWMKEPTTVIHSPQQKDHFALMLRVLGIVPAELALGRIYSTKEFQEGWKEISLSRGKAIEAGVRTTAEEVEEINRILSAQRDTLLAKMSGDAPWCLEMPENAAATGQCEFYPIRGIEKGFLAPESVQRNVMPYRVCEKWLI